MAGKVSTRGFVTALVLLGVAAGFSLRMTHARGESWAVRIAEDVPREFGAWKGEDQPVTEEERAILGTETIVARDFTNEETGEVVGFLAVYAEGNRRAFHPPEYCLTGAGLKLDELGTDEVDVQGRPLRYNRMVFVKEGYRLLVLNWYVTDEFSTPDFKEQQLNLLISMLRGGGRGAMLRITYMIPAGAGAEGEERADAVVKAFMKELLPRLPSYLWPEGPASRSGDEAA